MLSLILYFMINYCFCYSFSVDRGLPLNDRFHTDHRGSEFCIAFLQSGPLPSLQLHLLTDQEEQVEVQVSFHNYSSIVTNVSNNTVTVVNIPSELAITPSKLTRNAISISTSDPDKLISVIGQSSYQNSSDLFLALPVQQHKDVSLYQYAHFSVDPSQWPGSYSTFVLSNCDEVEVVPSLQSPAHLSGLIPVRDVYRLFVDSREFIEDRRTPLRMKDQFESLHFESTSLDMTGVIAWASRPFSFMSGLGCGSSGGECDHLVEQIPPSYTWGYTFHTFPLALETTEEEVPEYQVRVLSRYNNTSLTYFCSDGTNGSTSTSDEAAVFDFHSSTVCSFSSDRPIGIVQILNGGNSTGSAMTWLPPTEQYINEVSFVADLSNEQTQYVNGEFVSVVVPLKHYSPSMIKLDGIILQENIQEWTEVMCSPTEPCAYGTTIRVSGGIHTLHHDDPTGLFTAIVYGWSEGKGYAYPAGYALDPVGVPVISFSTSIYYGSESTNPVITLTRSGDIYIGVSVIVEITSISNSNDLRSDFISFNETVHFDIGIRQANMSLRVRDDLRVEASESFNLLLKKTNDLQELVFQPLDQSTLQIEDNDKLVIGFTAAEVSVSEETESLVLKLRSNIPLQDSGMNININTQDGTAKDSFDYDRLNLHMFLGPGMMEWSIPIKITKDNRVELTEHFFVGFEVLSSAVNVTIGIGRTQVNITDQDTVTVHFNRPFMRVEEQGIAQLTLVKDEASDIPVDVMLSTMDGSANGGRDYTSLANTLITFEVEETERIVNITILQDNILEVDETFMVQLSSNSRVNFDSGSKATVTILNDDSIEIGFNQSEFPVNENEGAVVLTVEIMSGAAERPFHFHAQTFQQQALEGSDYEGLDADLEFPPNQPSFHFNITLIDNKIAEQTSEGFTVALTRSGSDNLNVGIVEKFSRTIVAIKEDDNVVIEIDIDSQVLEGKEGGKELRIKLKKTGTIVAVVPVTVGILVFSGTALQGVDFTLDESVEFAPEETEKFATIKLLPDSEVEGTETFSVFLVPRSGPVAPNLNHITVVSILDSDITTVEFSLPVFSVLEGLNASVILSLSGPLNSSVSVVLSTSAGSASGADFVSLQNQAFTIGEQTTEFHVMIPTISDSVLENDENFTVSVEISSNSTVVLGSQSSTTVTINDVNTVSVILVPSSVTTSESNGFVTLTVQRIGSSDIDVLVMMAVMEISAIEGEDFSYSNSPIRIPQGETQVNITISIRNDLIVEERRERFVVGLVSLQDRVIIGEKNSTEITVIDDDVLEVLFDQSSYDTSEDSGTTDIRVVSIGTTIVPIEVLITTRDGTAIGGEDYSPLSQLLVFNSTVTENSVSITIKNDLILEGQQDFIVQLNSSFGQFVLIRDENIRRTVLIKDGSVSGVSLSVSATSQLVFENEGPAMFNITMTGDRQKDVSVLFRTVNGSATSPNDYNFLISAVLFSPDDSSVLINVTLVNDAVSEPREHFYGVIESSEDAVTVSNNQTIVTVRDDEGSVISLERSFYRVIEGEEIVIRILRSIDVEEELEVLISTTIGSSEVSAIEVSHTQNFIFFQPGSTVNSISIATLADRLFENVNETFQLSISLPENQLGAVIVTGQADIMIVDQDILMFTADNMVVSELNDTVEVCFSASIPSAIPVELEIRYLPSLTATAEVDKDFNVTQVAITVQPSLQRPASFCVIVLIIRDEEEEPDEHFCVTATDPLSTRVSVVPLHSTRHCPPTAVTVTINDAGVSAVPVCLIQDAMVVTPFARSLAVSPSYSYQSSCEHVMITQCRMEPIFTVNINHNLAISMVAVRIESSFILVEVDKLNYSTENLGTGDPIMGGGEIYNGTISIVPASNSDRKFLWIELLDIGLKIAISNDLANSTFTVAANVSGYKRDVFGELCGLCGTPDGSLLYSDHETRLTSRTTELVKDFVKSWLVNPEDQIIKDNSTECGALRTDSVIGDPLYTVPLYSSNSSLSDVSLCYEIHGSPYRIFNLVSDRCVSVNVLYSPMNNPSNGNIITAIGVKAVNTQGHCVNIIVTLSQQCVPLVESSLTMYYRKHGVSVMKHGEGVSVSVPNCENEQLIMWIMCLTIGSQKMIDFNIRRGLNLRSTSHGLLGQFWNIPIKISPYHVELTEELKKYFNQDRLFLVTVDHPMSSTRKRQFIGELYDSTWDRRLRTCLYVGGSQGGKLVEIPGPQDSVIEGSYLRYRIKGGLLGTSFKYSKFENTFC